jgi:hypothetical protein
MLWAAYILFAVVALAVLRKPLLGARVGRLALAALSIVFAGVGVVFAVSLAREPGRELAEVWTAYVLLGLLTAGALAFLAGLLSRATRSAEFLRAIGWGCMAAPLIVPSTLTLALPLVGVLAGGIRRAPGAGERDLDPVSGAQAASQAR